jgi:hypothetical protein
MEPSKNLNLRLQRGQPDNATDSLTTYSLMAVLAGSFFIQMLALDVHGVFITSWDKAVVLLLSGISLAFILLAAETVIDVFLFKDNNYDAELAKKYKRQLTYYNLGVMFLISTFVFSFWSYAGCKIYSAMAIEAWCLSPGVALLIQYGSALIAAFITFFWVTKRWRRDLRFIKKSRVVITHVG